MKKVVLIFGALLLVVSGIAAVSAFEGHSVDIRAHVENALAMPYYDIDFGSMFPQESDEDYIHIGLSESFRNQSRVSSVRYVVGWENKSVEDYPEALDPDDDGWFEPIYPFITLEDSDGEPTDGVYPADTPPTWLETPYPEWLAGWGVMHIDVTTPEDEWDGDVCDTWHLIFDVPVFDEYYNEYTDPRFISGTLKLADKDYELVTENICDEYEVEVPHADLGNNLKFQVWEFVPHGGGG